MDLHPAHTNTHIYHTESANRREIIGLNLRRRKNVEEGNSQDSSSFSFFFLETSFS